MPTKTYFQASDSKHGTELWVTDGTTAGTSFIADIYPGTSGSYPVHFAEAGTQVLFVANDGTHGDELWTTDGTAADTALLKDINPGAGSSNANGLVSFASEVIFAANDGTHGSELWVSVGTGAGAALLDDITPGAGGLYPTNLTPFNSEILFNARGADGSGLWETDGTLAGTKEITTIYPNSSFGTSSPITVAGAKAFWAASDGVHGTELWVTDGSTAAGTTMVDDIDPGTKSSNPANITALGDKVVFTANDGTHGSQLWVSDGTGPGTYMLKDIVPASGSSSQSYLTAAGGHVLFFANGATGTELWSTDGTTGGTTEIASVTDGADMAAVGGDVLFHGDNGTDGVELWISNGTTDGTHELKDIVPGSAGSYPYGLTTAGNHVLFSADTSPDGFNLWTSDGTAAGTYELSSTALSPNSFASFTTPACFAAGTRILTEHGPVTVESLAVGDRVITRDGAREPIVWIGRRAMTCEGHPKPEMVWPVWIGAGAFGANVPIRDLYLSPDHAVFVNGVLVPVKLLINGTSIAQVKRANVTYFHVELPRHAVILAEGLTVESYLDIGDREKFHQNGATIRLFPDFTRSLSTGVALAWETRGAAPLVMAGEELLKARRLIGAHVSRRTSRPGATIAFGRRLPAGHFG